MIEELRKLRAVRAFRPGLIPQQARADIFEVARWTGTARNRQAWELIWIDEPTVLKALGEVEGYAHHVSGATAAVAIVMSGDAVWEEQDVFDEGRLSERMMLAAAEHGIGGCIGWVDGTGVAEAKRILGVPDDKRLRTLISLGYPAPEQPKHRAGGRKPLDELAFHGRYGQRLS